MFLALQGVDHLGHQVVDIEQFQLHTRVVDRDGQVVGDVVAEGGYRAVVVGSAPFAEEVREAINQDSGSEWAPRIARITRIFIIREIRAIRGEKIPFVVKEQLLPCFFAAAVFGVAEAACQRGLLR